MKNYFELEFYYRSSAIDQLRALHLLESSIAGVGVSGAEINLRKIDLDSFVEVIPEGIPALPCLRRITPTPERLIVGPLKSREDVCTVLGLPQPVLAIETERFNGWTGLRK